MKIAKKIIRCCDSGVKWFYQTHDAFLEIKYNYSGINSIANFIPSFPDRFRLALQSRNGPLRKKNCLQWFANNEGADQPEHPRSLISTFDIRLLESIIQTCHKLNFKFLGSLSC